MSLPRHIRVAKMPTNRLHIHLLQLSVPPDQSSHQVRWPSSGAAGVEVHAES
jgi:hypothetical protein